MARENTLEAFREAQRLGVDGVELDVRRTLDGVLVVHHDPVVEGRTIAVTPASELPAHVPRLGDAMAVLEGLWVNVEVKNSKDERDTYDGTGAFVNQVLDHLYAGGWSSSLTLSCFDLATCVHARAYDPRLDVARLLWRSSLKAALREAHARGFNAVNPHVRLVTPSTRRLASELGVDLNVWTVNDRRDLQAMVDFEVASVITDQPARALELLASRDG